MKILVNPDYHVNLVGCPVQLKPTLGFIAFVQARAPKAVGITHTIDPSETKQDIVVDSQDVDTHCNFDIYVPDGFRLLSLSIVDHRSHSSIFAHPGADIICTKAFTADVSSGTIHLFGITSPQWTLRTKDGFVDVIFPDIVQTAIYLDSGTAMANLIANSTVTAFMHPESITKTILSGPNIAVSYEKDIVKLTSKKHAATGNSLEIRQLKRIDGLIHIKVLSSMNSSSWIGSEHSNTESHIISGYSERTRNALQWLSKNTGNPWKMTMSVRLGGCPTVVHNLEYLSNTAGISDLPLLAVFSAGLLSPQRFYFEVRRASFLRISSHSFKLRGVCKLRGRGMRRRA